MRLDRDAIDTNIEIRQAVLHCANDGGGGREHTRLPYALCAERIERRRRLVMNKTDGRPSGAAGRVWLPGNPALCYRLGRSRVHLWNFAERLQD